MDFRSSIARRTRSKEALYLRAEFEKRKNSNGVDRAGFSEYRSRKSEESNGNIVRVRDSQKLESKKEQEAEHVLESQNSVAIAIDSEEDETVEMKVGDGGLEGVKTFDSIRLDSGEVNRTDKGVIGAEELSTSSSSTEDGEDSDDDTFDEKRGRLDDDDDDEDEEEEEEEADQKYYDGGGKASFSKWTGTKSKESKGAKHASRSHNIVAIAPDSEEDEAVKVNDGCGGLKGGKTFDSVFLNHEGDNVTDKYSISVEEFASSSKNGEDSKDINDVNRGRFDKEEEKRSAGTGPKRKRYSETEAAVPGKKDKGNPITYVGCIAQRTRSRFAWRPSEKIGRNKKFETVTNPVCFDAKGIDLSGRSMDDHHHGVKEDEVIEMKDGGGGVKGERDFHSISSDSEVSTSSSEDGDGEDSDDTYEVGHEDEEVVEEDDNDDDEEEEEEERSIERLKRKKSSGIGGVEQLNRSNFEWKSSEKRSSGAGSVEQLHRSSFNWKSSEKKIKNKKHGTFTPPLDFDVEVIESSSGSSMEYMDDDDHGVDGDEVSVSARKDEDNLKTSVSNETDKVIPNIPVSSGDIAQLNRSNFNWKSSEKKSVNKKHEIFNDEAIPHIPGSSDGVAQVNRSKANWKSPEKESENKKHEIFKDKVIPNIPVSSGRVAQLNRFNSSWKSSEKKSENKKHEIFKDKATPNIPVRNGGVAQVNRSNFNWKSSEKKSENKKHGTVTPPICFEAEVIESSSGSIMDDDDPEADGNEQVNINEKSGDNADDGTEKQVGEKEDEELGKPAKKMHVRAPKSNTLFKLFVNTIWENGEVLEEDSGNSEDEAAEPKIAPQAKVAETSLPLKFSFGVEKPKLKEKSDSEKEMDQLWADFEFALRSSEMGSFAPSTVDIEDANEQHVETDPSTSCQLGKHHLILNEEIGIICRFCPFVHLEIKYVLPSMTTSPWERLSKKNAFGEGDFSMMDGVEFQDKGGDFQGPDVHTTGTIWDKFPEIKKKMFPHQQAGFEFMWKNLAGGFGLDAINSNCSDGVGGCVISHAPGTGKTFLTIAFLYTYMEIIKECRPLIIAPCSMLLTWEEEFKKWKVDVPFHNLNTTEFSGKENCLARKLVGNKPRNNKWNRIVKLYSWSRGKSILGVSYNLFEKLAGERSARDKEGNKQGEILCDKDCEDIRKILLERPTLLVLDEGHTPRNARSLIWKALNNIKTERRIILSGTPFQNNFVELYNTLWLVRPKFADSISSRTQKIGRKSSKVIEVEGARGKWASLTNSISTDADDGLLEEVRTMIEPFVHVHKGSILQKNLPGLRDCVVVLNPPPLQKQILEDIQTIQNSFELEHVMSLVSVHSSLLAKCSFSRNDKTLIEKITSKSFKLNPNEGVKTRFLMDLMRLCDSMNEKVLVFSQFIDPLALIKDQFQSLFNWTEGKEILQIDGKLDVKVRQTMINLFNDPCSEIRVLLASTRACREGINLVGASRIVLLDVVWNPSVERQAISRAYRLGQKKIVYTYHLITSGTKEADKYCRQVQKDRLSKLVFSTTHGDTDKKKISSTISDDKILEEMLGHDKLKDMFDKIIYQPKESDLVKTFGSVTSKQTGNGNFVG